jgi:hypothetical protein
MSDSTIRAVLEDGPRSGEVVTVDAGPTGGPPEQVVVRDPFGMGERAEESSAAGTQLQAATTYHLHGPARATGAFSYRTGEPGSAHPTTRGTDAEERASAQVDRLIANQQRSAALVEGLGTDPRPADAQADADEVPDRETSIRHLSAMTAPPHDASHIESMTRARPTPTNPPPAGDGD